MTFPGLEFQASGDGTNTLVSYKIKFTYPFVMDARTQDKFEVTVSDDISGLLFARVFVRGYKEEV
jgi:hypothetical protein